jgi:hypothetical protein
VYRLHLLLALERRLLLAGGRIRAMRCRHYRSWRQRHAAGPLCRPQEHTNGDLMPTCAETYNK